MALCDEATARKVVMIDFYVQGEPVPKGRPRFTRQGRFYTPKTTADYEKSIQKAFSESGQSPFSEGVPLKMIIDFYFTIPKSATKKNKQMMLDGVIKHVKRKDVDNCAKSVMDAGNGLMYPDDGQIVELVARKKYDYQPHTHIVIKEVEKDSE